MKAACGPYMALWRTRPVTSARTIKAEFPLASIGKKAKLKAARPRPPKAYTGRRPIRSESRPKSGMAKNWTAAPMSRAWSARLRVSAATSTRKVSEKTVRM